MGRGPIFLTLVLERDAPTQLDYLVNGVLETTYGGEVSRPERWIHLRKLRGTRIENPAYPFTLDEGRFQCVAPMGAPLLESGYRPEQEPDHRPGFAWPGCSDFAAAFGRLPAGHLTLIERDLAVPTDAITLFVRPAAVHAALQGARVLDVLPPNMRPDSALLMFKGLLSLDQISQRVRFLTSGPFRELPFELSPLVLPAPRFDAVGAEPTMPEAVKFLGQPGSPNTTNLAIVWTSALQAFAAEHGVEYHPTSIRGEAMSYLGGAPTHTIFIGPTDDPLVAALRTMASTWIRMRAIAGRVFLWGEQPATPMYVLSLPSKQSEKPYRLLRMV
jgi:hypothetical protein